MDTDNSIAVNGMPGKDDELKWNHKKRTKDRFLMFCEAVLHHEQELLRETLNSSQESISENHLQPDGQNNSSIENSTFNSDSDGAGEISNFTNAAGDEGDSFNSITCFCGKPFAGRPMIECSGCLTWLHMSCVKVKRKNIPEFYYCDNCKTNGLNSPTNALGTSTASSGEEATPTRQNGTVSSNSIISPDGVLYTNSTHQNNAVAISTATATTKPRKPKTVKKSSSSSNSLMMSSSDNIKNNANSDSKYLTKKSTVNGKLKKIRQSTKKVRPSPASNTITPTKVPTYGISSSSLAAAASLTALSLNNQQVSPATTNSILTNGIAGSENSSNNIIKSPIATTTTNNNNIYNNSSDVLETVTHENGAAMDITSEKYTNKRLKLL